MTGAMELMSGMPAFGHMRQLSDEAEDYEAGSRMAQIFSGVMFTALTCYLIFSNSTRMSYIQRASLEKRLNVCCQLNTIVAALSAFLNLFQVTEVDNWALPGQRQFTVDVARPIEWILTCPMMQLSLVLMGGSRIPEYRRALMPAFAVGTLLFGTLTLFLDRPVTYVCWIMGVGVHSASMYFNRQQILEHSRGLEGLLSGDSEFRKASLILMATWFPFPIWYILSPEGAGLVDDVTVVQMGWAFLNITAKFTLIFYIQRIKDNYCNRLKVTREMGGNRTKTMDGSTEEGDEEGAAKQANGDLRACVIECMNFLGMAENGERFMRLLEEAKIYSLDQVAKLEKEDCDSLQLPFDLVKAVQKRQRVWALEMVDDAEEGLAAGEKHYKVHDESKNPGLHRAITDGSNAFSPFSPAMDGFSNIQTTDENGNVVYKPWGAAAPFDTEKYEKKLFECLDQKFERVVEVVGRRMDKVDERFDARIRQTEEKLGQHIDVMMTRSDQKLGEKMELVRQAEEKLGDRVEIQLRRSDEKFGERLDIKLKQLDEKIVEKTDAQTHKLETQGKQSEEMMATRVRQLEEKLMEKVWNGLQEIALSADRSQTRVDEKMQDLSKAVERSQTLVESKVEYVLAAHNQQQREQVQTDNRHLIQQYTEQMQQHIHDAFLNYGSQQAKNVSQADNHLSTKFNAMEETQMKRNAELEENICRKLQNVMGGQMQNICHQTQQQTQSSIDRLGATVESSANTQNRLEKNLTQMSRDMQEQVSKDFSMGIGAVGNSLRLQLESMHSSQKGQCADMEKAIMTLIHKMQEQTHQLSTEVSENVSQHTAQVLSKKDAECMKKIENHIIEVTERASIRQLEDLKEFQRSLEQSMKYAAENTKKTNQVLTSALGGSSDATYSSQGLSKFNAASTPHLSGHGFDDSKSASSGRRASNSGGRSKFFD